ncbi:hypothetical protein [Thalassobacillus devorans]|uniref:hypothetical protein n=1 Tax=Thalassobacillus devorans TaxID=279813 RepID=UPI0007858999|nr:hypothetical protein [Thalassobacillus devorans]
MRDSYGSKVHGEIPQGFARGSSPSAHGKRVISRTSKRSTPSTETVSLETESSAIGALIGK